MTKLDEIRQRITELKAQAKIINDNENSTIEEIQAIRNRLNIELEREKTELLLAQNRALPEGQKHDATDAEGKYKKAFFNMMRNTVTAEDIETIRAYNKLSSTTGADGGFLVPQDQMTKINELKKERFSFRQHINIEPVSTKTGTRVIEVSADEVPFTLLAEGNDIPDVETPQFATINYDIKDYAGILPVPNNLLNDTDTAIEAYLNKWLARKSNATDNKLVLDEIGKIESKTTVQSIDELKKIRNTKLNMAFKATTKFFMNSDAFNYFSEEKDANGRPLLEYNPKNPTERMIDGCPVVEVPNDVMKTATNKAVIIIGDMKEFITLFDRQQLSIDTTKVGGDAWKKNNTELRAILREDLQKVDTRAIQIAEVDISQAHTAVIMEANIANIADLDAMIKKAVEDAVAQQQASMASVPADFKLKVQDIESEMNAENKTAEGQTKAGKATK